MASFTARDPTNREAFNTHWSRILHGPTVTIKTILFAGQVAGSVLCYEDQGKTEVSYWLGRDYWGRGIATRALSEFLNVVTRRPLYARAAKDNIGSLRVLQKCSFTITGEGRGFFNARGVEVEELILERRA
jgi:RimJ/RimL family protein N-acetyltransferase